MISLKGGTICNWFVLQNKIETTTEINAYKKSDTNLFFNANTQALGKFNSNLQAGTIDNLTEIINSWKIYRRKFNEINTHLVANVDSDIDTIIDYIPSNDNTYIYEVAPQTNSYVGIAIESNEITTNYFYWSLTDTATKDVWLLYLNIDGNDIGGSITKNVDITISTGNTKYPVISHGIFNYDSGVITALIGNIDANTGKYSDTVELKDLFMDFINNGNKKIFKTPKGELKVVDTSPTTYKYFENARELPTTVSFNWIECGCSQDLTLYDVL